MSEHVVVCPPHEPLLERLRGRRVVLRLDDPCAIPAALAARSRFELELRCLELEARCSLAALPLHEDWGSAPLALRLPSLGPLREVLRRLPLLRRLNLRVFLPVDQAVNITGLRLLASLGVNGAALLDDGAADWALLADLMTYALLGLVPHAPIEPFQYVASRYQPQRRTDFAAVYFDDPLRYLHLDRDGHVALSRADLRAGRFVAERPEAIDEIERLPAYRERLEAWRDVFLEPDGCACCPGWRVCLGKFAATAMSSPGCRMFFGELLDVTEQHRSRAAQGQATWQP